MSDPAMPARAMLAAFRTDAGRVRTNNEDLPVLDLERGVFGVIDGVGGHAAGERAAAIAHEVILQRLARPLGTPAERVREAIALANNEIFRRAHRAPDLVGMTCVVTVAVVHDGRVTVGHVGDSRLYKIRPTGLTKLTHDHSPVGEREDAHEIGELEAMRHPRRNEVFRDVGGALRDKDEDDYVEVIEDTLEADAAILVCSDGLTDMVPSATIDRLIREHAGDADAVTDALIAAANDAGGRDNVTVVYAETPGFAEAMRGVPGPGASSGPRASRLFRAVVASRTTWFACGTVLGVVGALLLVWWAAIAPPLGLRTIVAAPPGSTTFGTLSAAVTNARAGDVISLEPGTYAERLTLPDGVSLRARVPGASIFVRPAGAEDGWVAITAPGDAGGTIAGVRVSSTPESAVDIGVRVTGHGRSIELMHVDGPMRAGVDLTADASVTIQGSHFALAGAAVLLAERSQLHATANLFQSTARSGVSALTMADGAQVVLQRNVFAGFGPEPVQGLPAADREQMRTDNVVIAADPSAAR